MTAYKTAILEGKKGVRAYIPENADVFSDAKALRQMINRTQQQLIRARHGQKSRCRRMSPPTSHSAS